MGKWRKRLRRGAWNVFPGRTCVGVGGTRRWGVRRRRRSMGCVSGVSFGVVVGWFLYLAGVGCVVCMGMRNGGGSRMASS